MGAIDREQAKQDFVEFLGRKGLRLTSQRRAIVDTVFSTEEHFSAEQLLQWSREKDQSVSRATVYRTLPLLTESGMVREMDFGKDRKVYDPNYADHPNHSHLICKDCDKIVEFDSEKIERIEDEISSQLGFSVAGQRLQITGSCDELRKSGTCSKKNCSDGSGSHPDSHSHCGSEASSHHHHDHDHNHQEHPHQHAHPQRHPRSRSQSQSRS